MYISPTTANELGYSTYIFKECINPTEVFHLVPWNQESWGTLNYFIAFELAKKLNFKIVTWGDKNLLPFLSLISHEANVFDHETISTMGCKRTGIFEQKSVVNHFLPKKFISKQKGKLNINFLTNEHILLEIVSRIDDEFKRKYLEVKSEIKPRTSFPNEAITVLHKHNMFPENFYNILDIQLDRNVLSIFKECEHLVPYNSVWCEAKSRWYEDIENAILKYPPSKFMFQTLAKDSYLKSFQSDLYFKYPDYYMSLQILFSMFKNVKFICIGGSANIFSVIPAQTYFSISVESYFRDGYDYKKKFENEVYGNNSEYLYAPAKKLNLKLHYSAHGERYIKEAEAIMKLKAEQDFEKICNGKSDISEHLQTIRKYAEKCNHITELGVRKGLSTRAFLITNPKKLISIDLSLNKNVKKFGEIYDNVDWDYIQGDSTKIELEETDLLFIDTFHTYDQLRKELYLHGNKARKYLIFHDTKTFGYSDERSDGKGMGLMPAITEFVQSNPHWQFEEIFVNNNGLTILKRNY